MFMHWSMEIYLLVLKIIETYFYIEMYLRTFIVFLAATFVQKEAAKVNIIKFESNLNLNSL